MQRGSDVTRESDELRRVTLSYKARDASNSRRTYSFDRPSYQLYLQELEWQVLTGLRRLRLSLSGADVLDIGCGGGYLLHRMTEFGAASGTGTELSTERVEVAGARYPRLDIHHVSDVALPFLDESFDVVTQFTVLSSILDSATRQAVASEMVRVTRRKGAIVSYDVRPSHRALRTARSLLKRPSDAATPTRPVTEAELRSLFRGVGLDVQPVMLNLDLAELVGGRRSLIRALDRVPPLRSHLLAIGSRDS